MENKILSVPRHQYQHWCELLNDRRRSTLLSTSILATNTRTYSCVDRLPQELLLKIFNHFRDQHFTLRSLSLVCRKWFSTAIPLLYKHIKVTSTYNWAFYILTLTRDKRLLPYGSLLKSLDLSNGASYDNDWLDRQIVNEFMQRNSVNISLLSQQVPLPSIVVSTASLTQLATACQNLVLLNLSYTNILQDSLVVETGDYTSYLQHNTFKQGLTHAKITIEAAIQAIGRQCVQLRQLKLHNCDWVTTRVIWTWVSSCPNLTYLDVRSTIHLIPCLTTHVLQIQQQPPSPTHGYRNEPSTSSAVHQTHHSISKHQYIMENIDPSYQLSPQALDIWMKIIMEEARKRMLALAVSHAEHRRIGDEPDTLERNHEISLIPPLPTTDMPLENDLDVSSSTIYQHDSIIIYNQPMSTYVWSILNNLKKNGTLELYWVQF